MKKIVVVGATSAIAEHCLRLWAQNQVCDLVLLGRDNIRLERVAQDLKVRSPASTIEVMVVDFIDPAAITKTIDTIAAQGKIDIALIAQGSLPNQAECENNLELTRDALVINAISPALYAEALAQHMAKADHGTLAIISSVAGERGRKSNYVYGAAKGMLTRYTQGLAHRFAGTGVKVVLIKPGPTDTPMTADFKQKGTKLASVESVAAQIVNGMAAGKTVIYTPSKWWLIMMIIRHLPAFIFNKMNI